VPSAASLEGYVFPFQRLTTPIDGATLVSQLEPKPIAAPSTPDLESLDAAWGASGDDEEPSESRLDGQTLLAPPDDLDDLDDLDEGWETVPDPQGGPPLRRRRSPKERARLKREKQRARAEVAAKKQKKQKTSKGKAPNRLGGQSPAQQDANARPSTSEPARRAEPTSPVASGDVTPLPIRRAGAPRGWRGVDRKALAMIGAAILVAGGAIYYMMSHRP
jgi:hypothetical protein